MDTNLLRYIMSLPQVIQDLIGEFNVEHRKYTNKLNQEYMLIVDKKCKICNNCSSKDNFWSIDYFIINQSKNINYWCSEICYNRETNELIKQKYIETIEEYLRNKSIQFHGESIQL